MPDDVTALKPDPCPYCGSADIEVLNSYTTCHGCGADGPLSRASDKEEAVQLHNKRALAPAVREELLHIISSVEAAHFRTVDDTGNNWNALLVWNTLRRRVGLPDLDKAELPQYCGGCRTYHKPPVRKRGEGAHCWLCRGLGYIGKSPETDPDHPEYNKCWECDKYASDEEARAAQKLANS